MKFNSIYTTMIAMSSFASSLAYSAPIPNAQAAELSLHRIERLVILKKIDGAFETAVSGLTLQALPHQTPDQPSFLSTIYAYPGADGTQMSTAIHLDETGKGLDFAVSGTAAPVNAPTWPTVDAVTLSENCFHYLEDNYTTKPELVPYYSGVTQLNLTQDNSGATPVAVAILSTAPNAPILKLVLALDGTVQSANVVNQ